jgi:hypothetical protein
MGGENLSLCTPYRTLFCHHSPSREDTTRFVPRDLGDSALSARPWPSANQQGGKPDVAQDSGSFHRLVPDVTMVSTDGRPFLGHVATAASTGIDKLHLKAPRRLGLLLPYKRAGPGSTREKEKPSKRHQTNEQRGKPVSSSQINISSNHPCTLSFPLRPGLSSLFHNL